MKSKIVVAGGTGFVGQYLAAAFRKLGYEIIIISRQAGHVQWTDTQGILLAINNAAMLINLAGKSVDCRYTEENKREIMRSRTETTRILGEAVLQCNTPPPIWFNASTATIYRHAEDHSMTEKAGEIGTGFSVNVATQWEQTFFSFKLPYTRQVALRMAIVLGDGGVMRPFKNLVRVGLGGRQGRGCQKFSWIHIRDVFNILLFINNRPGLNGVFNCSAPHPVSNANLMMVIRETMHVKFELPSPVWLLKIGAVLIKTETELILKSRWVVPERLLEAGFRFDYPVIRLAIEDIVKGTH